MVKGGKITLIRDGWEGGVRVVDRREKGEGLREEDGCRRCVRCFGGRLDIES